MVSNRKSRILFCVEGEKTDVTLMEKLIALYKEELDIDYEIIPYRTNIYRLYNAMFEGVDPSQMDLLVTLREHEPDPEKKQLFNKRYSDILLVFDMDPQDSYFSPNKLEIMADYFNNSTDQGKLYLNFPMLEAFYHMKSMPDCEFNQRTVDLAVLKNKLYKDLVRREGRGFRTKEEFSVAIRHNVEKAWNLVKRSPDKERVPSLSSILDEQLLLLAKEDKVAVLCCCVFFIAEYSNFLFE